MRDPEDCHSMEDVRAMIDALDAQLVEALARRAGYIDRAAEIKTVEGLPARIDVRVEEVVRNVRVRAMAEGLDPALIETLWRILIDWSIAREEEVLGPDAPREGTTE
ncbi:chorismate mutase [Rhodobacter sp. CZR27]|uniref:chorismate mutase n=1 Tax=Rhodobacter sp. CZR27 TaxID=2033869 RepID=UPI000BBEEB1D|nr:chorismate mutase [Rhodobacter sp. CZR27]